MMLTSTRNRQSPRLSLASLGTNPRISKSQEPESEPELSKSEQRRQDRKAAERAKHGSGEVNSLRLC